MSTSTTWDIEQTLGVFKRIEALERALRDASVRERRLAQRVKNLEEQLAWIVERNCLIAEDDGSIDFADLN